MKATIGNWPVGWPEGVVLLIAAAAFCVLAYVLMVYRRVGEVNVTLADVLMGCCALAAFVCAAVGVRVIVLGY